MKHWALILFGILVSVGAGARAQNQSPEQAAVRALDDQERIATLQRDTTLRGPRYCHPSPSTVTSGPTFRKTSDGKR